MTYRIGNPSNKDFYATKRLTFDVLEDGIAIARATRSGGELQFKFYSDRAMYRFQDFCDSLSMNETCEALFTHLKK